MRYRLRTLLLVLALGPPVIYCVVRGTRFGGLDQETAWLFWLALFVWFVIWRGVEWWQFGRKCLGQIQNRYLKNPYVSRIAECWSPTGAKLRQWGKQHWMATSFAMGFAFAIAIWLVVGIAFELVASG